MVSHGAAIGPRPMANEGAREEEVLADVAVGPLHLALGLGAVRAAGAGDRAVVVQERDERSIVGDDALLALADHRGLHAVVEQVRRRPAHGGEGVDVAAQHRLQILRRAEPAPEPAAVPEDQREQPEDPRDAGLVGELYTELREVDLRLAARRRLEPALEDLGPARPRLAKEVGDDAVATGVAQIADLAEQSLARELGPGGNALAQVALVGLDQPRPRRAWAIGRWLEAALQVPAHGLAVEPDLARDGRDAEPLPLQVVDQDDLPESDHLRAPLVPGGSGGAWRPPPRLGGMPPSRGAQPSKLGTFRSALLGRIRSAVTAGASPVVPCTRTSATSRVHRARCASRAAKLSKLRPATALRFT